MYDTYFIYPNVFFEKKYRKKTPEVNRRLIKV